MPLIFLALMAILRIVVPVDEIHEDVKYLRNVAGLSVQTYPTVDLFYRDLRHAVDEATASLDLTHVRDQPPSDFEGSEPSDYFSQVINWVIADASRSVRRVIAVRNDRMLDWAKQLYSETSHCTRYQVRVIDWSIAAPAINLAIVDKRVAFLAITGESIERTRGLGVEDDRVAGYFSDYFNSLWHEGRPLETFLKDSVEPHVDARPDSSVEADLA
jgi:hypothetical protein